MRAYRAIHAAAMSLAWILCTAAPARADEDRYADFDVSIAAPAVKTDERITAFRIDFRGARIMAMPNVPQGWTLAIDNEGAWRGHVSGHAIVGAAALAPAELGRLLRIRKYAEPRDIAFALRGELTLRDAAGARPHARRLRLDEYAFRLEAAP